MLVKLKKIRLFIPEFSYQLKLFIWGILVKLHLRRLFLLLLLIPISLFCNNYSKIKKSAKYVLPEKIKFADTILVIDNIELKERFLEKFNRIIFDQKGFYQTIYNRYLFYKDDFLGIFRKYNTHEDYIFLAAVESGFNAKAQSGYRAAGMWQFIPSTARYFGLKVNKVMDERFDYIKSSEAACLFLNSLLKSTVFKDNMFLAVASFNAGKKSIIQASRVQGSTNFWDLILAPETENYLVEILLLKEIFSNPDKYGFEEQMKIEDENNEKWEVVGISSSSEKVSYNYLCKSSGLSFREFKNKNLHLKYNHYRENSFLPAYSKIWIRIPASKSTYVEQILEKRNCITYNSKKIDSALAEEVISKNHFFLNRYLRSGDLAFLSGINWLNLAKKNNLVFKRLDSGIRVPIIKNVGKIN